MTMMIIRVGCLPLVLIIQTVGRFRKGLLEHCMNKAACSCRGSPMEIIVLMSGRLFLVQSKQKKYRGKNNSQARPAQAHKKRGVNPERRRKSAWKLDLAGFCLSAASRADVREGTA